MICGTHTTSRSNLVAERQKSEKKKGTKEIVSTLLCSMPTITNICKKFAEGGLENALYDKPHPGTTPKITREIKAQLTMLACSAPPEEKRAGLCKCWQINWLN
jgi:hypothetical protein